MTTADRIAPLLMVQKQRVDQAMAQVRARNEVVRERDLQRNEAYDRWTAADAASRREQQRDVEAVDAQVGRGIEAVNLAVAAQRREWWRARVEDCWNVLAAAEAELAHARAAARQAQVAHREACNRQEALMTLAARWRAAQSQKRARAEEGAAEDMAAQRYATGR